ncbi:DUF1877 family protein [Streptomyces chryseus]
MHCEPRHLPQTLHGGTARHQRATITGPGARTRVGAGCHAWRGWPVGEVLGSRAAPPGRGAAPPLRGTGPRRRVPDADDWGYEPPRYLTTERVRLAAEKLSQMPYDELIRSVDHAELAAAEIYPQIWDSPTSLEWARDLFPALTEFFQAAASADHAIVIWLD